jgi:hypothetical protein
MTQDKRAQKKAKTQKEAPAPAPVEAEDQQTILMNALEVQEKIDENNEKLEQEIATLKQKYDKTNAPLIKKRSEQTKKIDQFWARVFVAHDVLSDLLTAEDVEALTFCTDVQVESNKSEDKEVITLTMHFASNPYFTNDKLTKTVTISEMDAEIAEQEDDEEFLAPNVQTEQSGINWKDGKKFTNEPTESDDEEEGKKGKKAGEKRDREEADMDEEGAGFFSFFEGETVFDEDVIETLMTEVVPSPFEYFMSADDSDDEGDMFAEMGDDSDDEEEEEEAPVVAVPVKQDKKQKPVKQEKAAPAKQEKPAKQEAPKQEKKQEQKKAAPAKQEKKPQQQQPKQEQKQGGNKQGGKNQQQGKQQGGKNQQQGGKKNKGKKGGK